MVGPPSLWGFLSVVRGAGAGGGGEGGGADLLPVPSASSYKVLPQRGKDVRERIALGQTWQSLYQRIMGVTSPTP